MMQSGKIDITFIIPTLNRTKFVERNIYYLNSVGPNFIVVDGSPKNYSNELNLLNENYISAPGKSFVERVILGVLESKTEYFMILPDDDYVDMESIKKIMLMMSESPHLTSATGYFLDLWYSAKKDVFYFRPVGIKYVEEFNNYENFKDRVAQYIEKNYCFLYSVVKSGPVKDYFGRDIIPLWAKNLLNAEDYLTFLFLSLGNNSLMPIPHLYRSVTPVSNARPENGKGINKPTKEDYANFFESIKNTNIYGDDLAIMLNSITARYRANIWRNKISKNSILKRILPNVLRKSLSPTIAYYYSVQDHLIFKKLIFQNRHGKHLKGTISLIRDNDKPDGMSLWRENRPKFFYFKLRYKSRIN